MSTTTNSNVQIRRATADDVQACGRICYDAFHAISTAHGFTPDFPSPDIATEAIKLMFSHPGFWCVVAEDSGKILGSNCLDERNPIAGVGPVTVDPHAQNKTVGRALMRAAMERVSEKGFAGTRLVQAGFHTRSLSLYTKLGFVVREPLACVQGTAARKAPPGYAVRPARMEDVAACDALCVQVHGHDRSGELRDGIAQGTALLAEFAGRVAAYSSVMGFFGYGVAENNEALKALIASVPSFAGPGILIPSRNADLFRWCLENGLRVTQTMTLMSVGLYNEPAGAWFPSVTY